MRGKIISFLFLLVIILIVIWIFYAEKFFTTQTGSEYQNITDLRTAYDAEPEIAAGLKKMQSNPEQAAVVGRPTTGQRQIALTFDGLADRAIIEKILDLLGKYKINATFFVDGIQTAEDPTAVVNIRKAGQKIENYSLMGLSKMENLPAERLVKDFCRSQKIVKITVDHGPNILKLNDTNYTERVLQAANACGFKSVVKSDIYLTRKNANTVEAASTFVNKLKPGSIVTVKLKPNLDPILNEKGAIDLRPAVDKQPGLKVLPKQVAVGDHEIIKALENLLIALNQEKMNTVYVDTYPTTQALVKSAANNNTWIKPRQTHQSVSVFAESTTKIFESLKNELLMLFSFNKVYAAEAEGGYSKEIRTIYTTEPALAYSFSGLANEEAVQDVLNRLNNIGSKATFFISEIEMKKSSKLVRQIIKNGHEIGLAIRPKPGETAAQTEKVIHSGLQLLHTVYGVKTNLVKQPLGAISETTFHAVANAGCIMIGQTVTVVQSKHKDYMTAEQVAAEIFPKSIRSYGKGQIVHFRMDYYTNSRLIGDMMEYIKKYRIDNIAYATFFDNPEINPSNDSVYKLKPVGTILGNNKFNYHYPVDLKKIPTPVLKEGPRFTVDKSSLVRACSHRYIGNKAVNDEDRMLDFSRMETRRLDKSGLIHTDENVIFLTFDDWGSDAALNKLLYVLRKHNVPGTFFIITRGVQNNANLLRTIAMEGHEIGNHSENHRPMAAVNPQTEKLVPLNGSKEEYLHELRQSYNKLRDIVGDVYVNGKHPLTRLFRPPQLAISKKGLEAVFEAGFEFIVNGSYSTNDYSATDVAELMTRIKTGIYSKTGALNKGAVLVMHMSDTAPLTPIALDLLLTANAAKADSDPSKFYVGRLGEYLTGEYSQVNRQKSLLAKRNR